MRSVYKVPFVDRSTFNKYINHRKKNNIHKKLESKFKILKVKVPHFLVFWKKNTLINKNALIGKKIVVYNGKYYIIVNLNKYCIGYRLGQLVVTKKMCKHTSKNKKVRKVIKKGVSSKSTSFSNLTLKKFMQKKKIKKWV